MHPLDIDAGLDQLVTEHDDGARMRNRDWLLGCWQRRKKVEVESGEL